MLHCIVLCSLLLQAALLLAEF